MFDKIDLEKVLRDGNHESSDAIPDNIHQFFNDENRNGYVLRNIFSKGGSVADFAEYNIQDIFPLEKIKKLCIEYNLRFLNASYFKGEIPLQALSKIKYLEDSTNQEFKKYKIIAPARRFQLEDENADPLLFVDIGNNQFLFIHKWGEDLNWHQKIINIPARSYSNLAITAILLAAVISLLVPNQWLTTISGINYINFYRILFFFWISFINLSFISFYWMSFRKNVSSDCWDKKTE